MAKRLDLTSREYVDGVRAGDRRALARAITLIESMRRDDVEKAQQVLDELLPATGGAWRVGVTGVPGVGKSTFIEALGTKLVADGHRLAVLAVDPSSAVSGGSILGDKTRMDELSRDDRAFIRPSPAAGTAGGVARRTREAMLLCEAAGFDVVLVETVGVGQAETAVAGMVDFFLLLMLAGAGDDLQGIKRGILELADGVVITKADGDNKAHATEAARELRGALHILQARSADWTAEVLTCSARDGRGLDEVWATVAGHRQRATASGAFERRRRAQALQWFEQAVDELLAERFFGKESVAAALPALRAEVLAGQVAPAAAARRLVDLA